jgi:hypothetical protein
VLCLKFSFLLSLLDSAIVYVPNFFCLNFLDLVNFLDCWCRKGYLSLMYLFVYEGFAFFFQ